MKVLDKLLEYIRIMLPDWEISVKEDDSTPTYRFTCIHSDRYMFEYIVDTFPTNALSGRKNLKLKRIIQFAFLIAYRIKNCA